MLLTSSSAIAQERAIEVELRPTGDPQIAIWLEDAEGRFVDTMMVTKLVGTFGLGNRPGRWDFGGGFLWPYGRREMALPIWAHRRNVQYDRLVFQDCRESSLGWHETHSSTEPFYCRPVTPAEMSVDVITCPTTAFNTDKGIPVSMVNGTRGADCAAAAALPAKSLYPPRNDVTGVDRVRDWSGVSGYSTLNDLDAVSKATPPANQPFKLLYQLPAAVAPGEYTVWIEVNQEYDTNEHHVYDFFPDPQLRDYGLPSIGQPSVVWRVPVTVGGEVSAAQVKDYAGYGSWNGQDGTVRPPDATISTDVPGSGARRLADLSGPGGPYRVRVSFNPEAPCEAPAAVGELRVSGADYSYVDLTFVATAGASMFETRYAEGSGAITNDADFMAANPGPTMIPEAPGSSMSFRIDDLRPKTKYSVAIRSYDHCRQASAISALDVETPERVFATVDACFIATAAYGAKDAAEVRELRAFRDRVLLRSELGRAFVDTYYGVSPPIAELVREHASLRLAVRTLLGPVVTAVRDVE